MLKREIGEFHFKFFLEKLEKEIKRKKKWRRKNWRNWSRGINT
jgi:hypothetical protein